MHLRTKNFKVPINIHDQQEVTGQRYLLTEYRLKVNTLSKFYATITNLFLSSHVNYNPNKKKKFK